MGVIPVDTVADLQEAHHIPRTAGERDYLYFVAHHESKAAESGASLWNTHRMQKPRVPVNPAKRGRLETEAQGGLLGYAPAERDSQPTKGPPPATLSGVVAP